MFKVVDMFCGAGGESVGIESAARESGERLRLSAINHWEQAIETHKMNFPDAVHYCENVDTLNPHDVCGVREKIGLLWASPECTHHSNARGGRPCSDQSRATAWHILKWASELYIRRIIIENVPEFVNWGPLGSDGRPLKQQKGKTFEIFIKALQTLGYKVEWQFLCAANYGDPTTRRRFFLQAVRGKGRIMWPTQTHSEHPGLFKTKPWVAAREIIDWKQRGESIINRKRPLAPATMRRIEAGIKRYWGQWAEPFLIILRGTGTARDLNQPTPAITAGGTHLGLVEPFLLGITHGGRLRKINRPMPTVTTAHRGEIGIVEPFMVPFYGEGKKQSPRTHSVNSPLPTVVSNAKFCVIEPFILHQMTPGRPRKISEPLPAITTQSGHGIVEPFLVQYYGHGQAQAVRVPLATCTTKDRFALIEGKVAKLDITFRMLQPHELAAAQGFPKGYIFTGNKGEQVKQIGNAVPTNTAKALALSALGAA